MRVLHLVSWFLTASSDQSHSPSSSAWSKYKLWPLTASLSLFILYPFSHICSSICEIFRWSPDSGLGLCWARGTERERGTSLLLNSIQSRKLKYQVNFKTEHSEISSTTEMCARRHLVYLLDPGVELALVEKGFQNPGAATWLLNIHVGSSSLLLPDSPYTHNPDCSKSPLRPICGSCLSFQMHRPAFSLKPLAFFHFSELNILNLNLYPSFIHQGTVNSVAWGYFLPHSGRSYSSDLR